MSSSTEKSACKCKVGRCDTCGECRRCGCEHDGVPLTVKLNRKRGGQTQEALSFSTTTTTKRRNKRKSANYTEGSLAEPSATDFQTDNIYGLSEKWNPKHLCSAGAIAAILSEDSVTPTDILTAFGEERQNALAKCTNFPSSHVRSDPKEWESLADNKSRLSSVLRVYETLFLQICEAFCGRSQEAAEASLAAFCQRMVGRMTPTSTTENDKDKNMHIAREMANCYSKAKKGSIEKRVTRAYLAQFHGRTSLQGLQDQVPGFAMYADAFLAGRQDYKLLINGEPLVKVPRVIQRFQPRDVDEAVSFILSNDNVAFTSWGTKKLRLDGRAYIFPAIMRKKTRTHIYQGYVAQIQASGREKAPISRSHFFKVVNNLTAGESQQRKAVDYVTGFLVNDSFDLLRQILQAQQLMGDVRDNLMKEMDVMRGYLKYGFEQRLKGSESSCILHKIDHGLDTALDEENATDDDRTGICLDCKSVFYFFDKVKRLLVDLSAPSSAIEVVDDCCQKAKLFMGHKVRTANQQVAISKILQNMKEKCLVNKGSDEAHVVMDFKMKLEPMYFREKTVEHYGKRRISWHGVMVQYCSFDEGDEDNPPDVNDNKVYFDMISDGDDKQDRESVFSMVEAMLMRLKQDLPHIRRIGVQSDNATSYQNTLLPLVLPYVCSAHGILLDKFVHTETQDGRSVLDAHFARSMEVLKSWVREGNNCVTPTQAVVGLKSHLGMSDSTVELVEHDRDRLAVLVKEVEPMEKQFKRHVKRVNEIVYYYERPADILEGRSGCDGTSYRTCPDFTLVAFEYSGVGNGKTFKCKPSQTSCELISGRVVVGVREPEDDSDEEDEELPTLVEEEIEGEEDEDEGPAVEEEESDLETETVNSQSTKGPVTGIQITTQGQLRRRQKRWRSKGRVVREDNPVAVQSKDIISYAVRRALHLHQSRQIVFTDAREEVRTRRVEEDEILANYDVPFSFSRGWAVRPPKGTMYGRRYVANFKEDIKELFMLGERNKSMKQGPGRMLEALRQKYPNRYDLPSESEIRQEITKLMKQVTTTKQRSVRQSQPTQLQEETDCLPEETVTSPRSNGARGQHSTIPPEYVQFFEGILATQPNIKPQAALDAFRREFPNVALSDKQLKTKFSNLKAKNTAL